MPGTPADARPLVVVAGRINPDGLAQLEREARVVVTPDLEPATVAALRGEKGLAHAKEPLARASAALALAQAALRTNDQELVRLLDREIPIVLIDSVGARNQHYRDFGSVMPLSYAMLRRITGQGT